MSTRGSAVFARRYRAFLFDMDGTLLNSIAAAERVWGIWAERHGLDVPAFLATIHGARAIDTITRQALPGVDPEVEATRPVTCWVPSVWGCRYRTVWCSRTRRWAFVRERQQARM